MSNYFKLLWNEYRRRFDTVSWTWLNVGEVAQVLKELRCFVDLFFGYLLSHFEEFTDLDTRPRRHHEGPELFNTFHTST